MEVGDGEYEDEATVWGEPCNNGVGEIEGDKARDDGAGMEDNCDCNDDAASFIPGDVFVVAAAAVVAIVTDDKDCTCK